MIKFCSNLWSDVLDWKQDLSQQSSEWLDRNWDYYAQERAVIKGFPIAVISSIAAAYLFRCTQSSTGAIFGAVNYLTLTSILEIVRENQEIDKTKAFVILGVSAAISLGFVRTVCRTSMTYQTAIILATAAFAGQLAREALMTEDY